MFSHPLSEPVPEPLEAGETELFRLPGSSYPAGSRTPTLGQITLTSRWLRFRATGSIASLALSGLHQGGERTGESETIDPSQIERVEARRRMVIFRELVVTLRGGRVFCVSGAPTELESAERSLRERMGPI